MFNNNFLPKALFISLTLHTAFVCSGLLWHFHPAHRPVQKRVEISYRPDKGRKAPDVRQHPVKPSQKLDLKNTTMMTSDGTVPLKLAKESQPLAKNFMMHERKPEQIRSAQMAHRVTITPIKSAKINNPAYAAYNEMVRNRIEEKVYQNYRKMEAGAIYLTFILSSDGTLKASQIIDEKSRGSQNLKDTSIKSLHQAQFPPFLKGMTLPEYTFNIEIQYQVHE
jgi:hypothetical protein